MRARPAPTTRARGLRLKAAMTSVLIFGVSAAFAQTTPVGLWRNLDDKTGEAKAEIRIAATGEALNGRIEKILRKDAKPDEKCGECSDDRKDKPMVGLEIIRGAKKAEGKEAWEGELAHAHEDDD